MKLIPLALFLSLELSQAAVEFNGLTNFLGTAGTTTNLGSSTFTVACWFRRTTLGRPGNSGSGGMVALPLVAKAAAEVEGSNQDGNYFLGLIQTNDVIGADYEDAGTGLNHPVFGVTRTFSNRWYHAACSWNSNTFALYLDGVLEASVAVTNVPRLDSIQRFAIGSCIRSDGLQVGAFGGQIAEVAVWNRALQPLQIFQLAKSKRPRMAAQIMSTNLLAYWPLDDVADGVAVTRIRDWKPGSTNYLYPSNSPAPVGRGISWAGNFTPVANPNQPPAMTTEADLATPVDRTANTSITIAASGANLTYQWRCQGTNISNSGHWSGATTATLTITGAVEDDSGKYDCVVANAYGSVISRPTTVVIYHSTDAGVTVPGSIAVLGDRESGYDVTRATAVDNAIIADTSVTNMVSCGDCAGTGTTYAGINTTLKSAINARGGNIFPSMGNHDYDGTNETFYGVFFDGVLTNNNAGKFYYSQVIGNVEFFMYDDNTEQGSTNGGGFSATAAANQGSTMGQWIIGKMTNSTAAWKIYATHHPSYTDSTTAATAGNRWPFSTYGVNMHLQAHAHGVERLYTNGYFAYTAALGGGSHHGWNTRINQTEFRIDDTTTNGYLRISSSASNLVLEYYSTFGIRLDRTVLFHNPYQ